MNNTYIKCINLFAADKLTVRVLIITSQDIDTIGSKDGCSISADITLLSTCNKIKLEQVLGQIINQEGSPVEEALYDLVILDRISEAPVLDPVFHTVWRTRHQMLQSLSGMVNPDGSGVIILADNTMCVHKISNIFNAMLNQFVKTGRPGSFVRQYTKELEQTAFNQFDHYYVLPNFDLFSHLVSGKPDAGIAYMMHSHGFSLGMPRRPRRWFLWLAVKLKIDFWFIPCQLLWARK